MKRIMIRFLVGFPLGIFMELTLLILYSLWVGSGQFMALVPYVRALLEPELTAFLLQLFIGGILGSLSISMVTLFESYDWSIPRIVMTHVISMFTMMITALCAVSLWHSSLNVFLGITIIFVVLMIILYVLLYRYTKQQVCDLNRILTERK